MKGKLRGWWIGLCGALAALALVTGIGATQLSIDASANSGTPTVTMLAGASVRKTGDSGIKFEAKIDDYDSSYDYGMLILPEGAWKKFEWANQTDPDYIKDLDAAGVTYANKEDCTVYTRNGNKCISYSLTKIQSQNYGLSFVGVAYTHKDGVYNYADVNLIDNSRSIAYVARMALKYEDNLSYLDKTSLSSYANAGVNVNKNEFEGSADSNLVTTPDDYVARFDVDYVADGGNAETANSFVTKNAYAAGTSVSFKTFIPEDSVVGGWWSVCWTADPTTVDIYAHASGNGKALSRTQGTWNTESFTLPTSGGPYYIYFAGAKGEWGNYGAKGAGYVYIDNFTVGSVTESFSANTSSWIFAINTPTAVSAYCYEKGGTIIGDGGLNGEYGAQIYMDDISSEKNAPSFITKEKYTGGVTITFDYYMSGNTLNKWWTLNWTNDQTVASIYAFVEEDNKANNYGVSLPVVQNSWQKASVELPAGEWYLYFAGAVGEWSGGYVTLDNIQIGSQETEDFNQGLGKSIFLVNSPEAIVDGEGYVYIPDTTDYMLSFAASAIGNTEKIAMITDKAYAGVTEITFKAMWASDATSGRWGLSYTNTPSAFGYDDGKAANELPNWLNCYTPRFGELKMDGGVVYTYKVTIADGAYTVYAKANGATEFSSITSGNYYDGNNYFYIMACPTVSASGAAFYMDDFSITYGSETVTDTFAEGKSNLFVESATKNSSHGSTGMTIEKSTLVEQEGGEDEALGEVALKMLFNNGDDGVRARTTKAYDGGSKVEFKYYIQADTKTQWTRFIWDTDTSCDNYADTYTSFGNVAGEWTTWSYTLPDGGPYYLYFGFECGNWSDSSGAPYILIDDFTVNGEVETFNYGVEKSSFTVLMSNLAGNSAVGEGYAPLNAELGAKLIIDMISSTKTTPSFITAEKYAGGTVTFDYYMSGNANGKWWTFNWTNSNTVASIYAFVESNEANNYGVSLPVVQDSWQTATVTVPAGEWYFYFAGAVGEWNSSKGYVIIDNLYIESADYTETFNSGLGIFLDNRSSKPDAITLTTGKEPFIPGEYAAKLDFSNSFDNNGKTFITKQAIATGGSSVSFKYMIPNETTVGEWWAICYTTDASSPDFWAVGNGLAEGGGGVNPNPNKTKGVGWVEYSVTLPNDGNSYYLYFTGYQNWSGYVYIDDFQVISTTGIYYDDFTNGANGGLFTVGNAEYVSYGDGYVDSNAQAGEYSAKIAVDKLAGTDKGEFITKQSFAAGSVVTFDYFIPADVTFKAESTWWTLCVTSNPLTGASIYSNHYSTLPKVQNQWQTVTITLNKAGYIYFAAAIGEWNGGSVYIDNFSVTTDGKTVTEDFNKGLNGLFVVSTAAAITYEKTPTPASIYNDPWSLEALIANGSIVETLASGGYAYITLASGLDATGLPASLLFLEGSFQYVRSGEKQFAIYFGGNYYLAILNDRIALYNDTQLMNSVSISAENATLYLAVTAGGRVYVKLNDGGYVGMGEMSAAPTTLKIVGLGGDGSASFREASFAAYAFVSAALENVPVYFPTDNIDFTAYAFDSDNMISEAGFKLLSEAGFTKSLALLQGRCEGDLHEQDITDAAHVDKLMAEVNKDAIAALLLAEKYGMKHYALNSNLYNIERNPNNYQWLDEFAAASYNEYSEVIIDGVTKDLSKAFAGFFLADEPQADIKSSGSWLNPTYTVADDCELAEMVKAYKAFRAAFPNSEAYINLLPNTSTSLTQDAKYKAYVQYYVENIALDKDGVKGTGYVSYDHYPLQTTGITTKHLRNLEIIAELCRDNNLEFRTYIKASESGDSSRLLRATQSVNDLYLQIYSGLAYGVKEFNYYQFTDHNNTDDTAGDAVINGNTLDTTAPVYQYAKKVNNEVHALEAAYMSFKWNSASFKGSSTQSSNLQSAVTIGNHGTLSSVTGDHVLIGNFTDADGKYTHGAQYAYMLVNYANTATVSSGTVTATFNNKTRALVYENGTVRVETLSNGTLSLTLEVGEGAFVIPLD